EGQRQSPTHRQARDDDAVVVGLQPSQLRTRLAQPVRPSGGLHVLPGGAVPGQQWGADVEAFGGDRSRDRHPDGGGAADSVQEQHRSRRLSLEAAVGGHRIGPRCEIDLHASSMAWNFSGRTSCPGDHRSHFVSIYDCRGRQGVVHGRVRVFYWFLKRVLAGPILRILFRPWVRGLDNLPTEGPAIIAGNHNHFMDSIFVPLLAPRPVVYLAKKAYFTGRGLKGALTRWVFKLTNQLPMDRGGGSGSQASLESGLKVLGEGNCLGIYPEGTRSPDGKLYRGRTGIARLVLESEAPVVPVAIIGTDKLQPAG